MTLQHIVAATDFSNRAARAVHRTAMLAGEHRATVELVHVTAALPADQAVEDALSGGTHDALQRELVQALENQIAEQVKTLDERFQVLAAPRLVQGKAYLELPRLAAERNADLIVIGDHGRRVFLDLFRGSTAERVLHRLTQPFLIVKEEPVASYRNILVPVDFSPGSEAALSVAADYFPDAVFTLLHAYEALFERKLIGAGISDSALARLRTAAEQETLRRMSDMLHTHSLNPARVALWAEHGHPVTVIRNMRERLRPDLIIMGRNEHSAVEKLLFESVTRQVLREVECDVLVVASEQVLASITRMS